MKPEATNALDPATLVAFAGSLANLSEDEMRKAKTLYLRDALADFRMEMKNEKTGLITVGVLSIIPIFLLAFIPSYFQYKAARENGRQKILNALEVWRKELGSEYDVLLRELETI